MKTLLVCIFILIGFNVSLAQQSFIFSGDVKDKNGSVLPGTGIYISGYKIATAADNHGEFSLSLKPGNYDVLFQLMGYKPLTKNIIISDRATTLQVTLEESVTQLAEVTIKPDPNRGHYISMFKDFFIGNTPNSLHCKIINPNVLQIDYDKENGILSVKTDEFLIIENLALGYRIRYLVKNFEWSSKTRIIYYEGFPYYEDLKGSDRKRRIWAKNRLTAYSGSSQHFFKSLYANRITEEGFIINKLITQPNTDRPSDNLIDVNIKQLTRKQLANGGKITIGNVTDDSLSYWMRKKKLPKSMAILNRYAVLQDTLVKTANKDIKSINFTDKLYIVYTKEQEDASFLNRINQSISRPMDMSSYQISTIDLQVAPVYFYANGGIYNPRSMLYAGYWAWEKIADSVPMDYLPPSNP